MTLPYTLANGPGNYPDATKFMANYNHLEVLARRNRIINGNFAINQRGLTSVADDAYCLDRWYVLTETGNVTVAQELIQEAGSPTSIKLTQPDATAKRIGLAQAIEQNNIYDVSGCVLTGRVKCSVSQPIRFSIIQDGYNDLVTSDVVGNWTSAVYTESNFFGGSIYPKVVGSITPAANTWTDFSLILPDGGNSPNLVVFLWTEGTLTQNGTLEFARVALRQGSEVVQSETYTRTMGEELALCQRYFEKTYNVEVVPGTVTNVGAVVFRANGTSHLQPVSFKTKKRTTPTVTIYNSNSGATGTWRDSDGSTDRTTTADFIGSSSFMASVASTVDQYAMVGHWTASAEL